MVCCACVKITHSIHFKYLSRRQRSQTEQNILMSLPNSFSPIRWAPVLDGLARHWHKTTKNNAKPRIPREFSARPLDWSLKNYPHRSSEHDQLFASPHTQCPSIPGCPVTCSTPPPFSFQFAFVTWNCVVYGLDVIRSAAALFPCTPRLIRFGQNVGRWWWWWGWHWEYPSTLVSNERCRLSCWLFARWVSKGTKAN